MHVQDARVAAVEHALAFLADYTDTGGGDFLARRFVQEAWPQLALLLHRGPNTALGSDQSDLAPAVVQRARMAVLTALLRCMHLRQLRDPLSISLLRSLSILHKTVSERQGREEELPHGLNIVQYNDSTLYST